MDHRAALIVCLLAPQTSLAQYTVHELVPPPGARDSVVTAIDHDGRIVGSAWLDTGRVALTWAAFDAEPRILGSLDAGQMSEAVAVTSGLVVGVSGRDCGQPGAFMWTSASGMTPLGPEGCSSQFVMDISPSGEVLMKAGEPELPLVWPVGPGTPRTLETWGQPAAVLTIDGRGRVLGSSAHHPAGGGIERAVQWDAGGGATLLARLDPEAGGLDAATDRNDAGLIVGLARLGSVSRATVWDESGEPIDAGQALGPTVSSHLLAINEAGQAVGASALGAILWTRADGAVELAALVDQTGDGWELHAAQDINGPGIIVGNGINPNGRPRAFALVEGGGACPADLDGDGELTLFDFLAFQNLFDAGDPRADFDGDGELTIFDFLAFQNEFDAGCG